MLIYQSLSLEVVFGYSGQVGESSVKFELVLGRDVKKRCSRHIMVGLGLKLLEIILIILDTNPFTLAQNLDIISMLLLFWIM